MLLALWGRITGKDKKKKYPDQQAVFLGRVGDKSIVFPYGLYADLPIDTLLLGLKKGVAVPVTVKRPEDIEQGETTFFHPTTNTRIIVRNNGDLDIITDDGTQGSVNITCVNANIIAGENIDATAGGDVNISGTNVGITASDTTTINSPNTNITGALNVSGSTTLAAVTSNGVNVGSTHTHAQDDDSGGNSEEDTGPPK